MQAVPDGVPANVFMLLAAFSCLRMVLEKTVLVCKLERPDLRLS